MVNPVKVDKLSSKWHIKIMKLPKELTTVTPLSKYLAMILFISLPFVGFFLGMRYQEMLDLAKRQQTEANLSITRVPTPTLDKIADEIDYYSCKDLEKLPFQYVESIQFAIGYLDISGTLELRSEGKRYLGNDQEVNGIYLKIPIQKAGEKGLFYSQFIKEAKGGSANADIEGEDLLFRLGEYDDKNIFSSEATFSQNFHSEIEKALQDKKIINLHLVISIPLDRDASPNTSGACKIQIL